MHTSHLMFGSLHYNKHCDIHPRGSKVNMESDINYANPFKDKLISASIKNYETN